MKIIQSSISSKYQTVVPADVRRAMNLGAGDALIWQLIRVNGIPKAVAEPKAKNWTAHTRGLGQPVWQNIDIKQYINDLRDEWQNRN
jgi:hypothetical protein